MKEKFSISLMCMDLLRIREQIEIINQRADFFHVDIMDGHYVKNITLSPSFVEAIKPVAKLPIDVHLMVEYPSDYIAELGRVGADYICPQAETINKDAFRVINQIRSVGSKVGIVLNPATPFSYIKHYVDLIDKLTIMTVDPGFAGQPFIPQMLEKIQEVSEYKKQHGSSFLIEVDGSCNKKTFQRLHQAGTEVFILGTSGLFNLDPDLNRAYDLMLEQFRTETGVGQ